jgi:hypothetical protein
MTSLESLYPSYWNNPSVTYAWRLSFELTKDRKNLLTGVMRHLPSGTATIEFSSDLPSEQLIILFTLDPDNEGARQNLAQLYLSLMETNAVSLYGTEGAAGGYNFEPYRTCDNTVHRELVSEFLLSYLLVSPIEEAAIRSSILPLIWGIEDPDQYVACVNAYRENSVEYWKLIDRRFPKLFENLLAKMDELQISVSAVELSDYNFDRAHDWFSSHGIAHIGIRALSSGKTHFGHTDFVFRHEGTIPLEEWFKMFGKPPYSTNKGHFELLQSSPKLDLRSKSSIVLVLFALFIIFINIILYFSQHI